MADKKNQHYVPKCYLRQFAVDRKTTGDQNRVLRLFHVKKKQFILNASIRHQAKAEYYYGKDLKAEHELSRREEGFKKLFYDVEHGDAPRRTTRIIQGKKVITLSKEYSSLLEFVLLTDLRNPIREQQHVDQMDAMDDLMPLNKGLRPVNPILESLAQINEILPALKDLDYRILLNETATPFVTSDYPIAKYNQLLEFKERSFLAAGYGLFGVEVFVPITDRIQLLLFDSACYNIENPNYKYVRITRSSDVDAINQMHLLNALSCLYGNERFTNEYAMWLAASIERFDRPHGLQTEVVGNIQLLADRPILMKLQLSFVQFTRFAVNLNFSLYWDWIRPHAKAIHDEAQRNKAPQ